MCALALFVLLINLGIADAVTISKANNTNNPNKGNRWAPQPL